MRRIRVSEYGDPEVMVLEEAPAPEPAPGQALVRLEAAGVNFIDIYHRSGAYKPPLPLTPGSEGAGVVEAVGQGAVSYTHLRAHETDSYLVCRLLLEKKKK